MNAWENKLLTTYRSWYLPEKYQSFEPPGPLMKGLWSFEMSGTSYPVTWYHIVEEESSTTPRWKPQDSQIAISPFYLYGQS